MRFIFILVVLFLATPYAKSQPVPPKISVIGYYSGDAVRINDYPIEKLTHIIFSFCHLKGNKLSVKNMRDTLTIRQLVSLKGRNPSLKVILSLGGWGGCETCSTVFSTRKGRRQFARSVKKTGRYFKTDGLDLDWEYPGIPGYPGHAYTAADKPNFTALVQALRKKLGKNKEISFAAGGFTTFLAQSIEWQKITPLVDKINLMTYDLVHGFSTVSGHHTPLYSTAQQLESTDHAVRFLDSIGVPRGKMVIGAAFYSRIFDVTTEDNFGLYQPGKFSKGISYRNLNLDSLQNENFVPYWDSTAQAPYMYSPGKKQLITWDNERSIILKTRYAIDKQLNGIMFWQLADDKTTAGLLDAIDKVVKNR